MTESSAFRRAVEAHSLDAITEAFAEDAVPHSPITFQPFEGRPALGPREAAGRGQLAARRREGERCLIQRADAR